jgi:PEGA domain-containing protein
MESMKLFTTILILLLSLNVLVYGESNSFNKIRYLGGSVQSAVDPEDWNNTLLVSSDLITLILKDGQTFKIQPAQITTIAYGQQAQHRVSSVTDVGVKIARFFHKKRDHFLSLEFNTPEKSQNALLLQADKDNYKNVLIALHGLTHQPISVNEDEAKFIPTGVTTNIVKDSETETAKEQPANAEKTTCRFKSTPEGADIYIDDAFVGNAPAQLKLSPGKHQIRMTLKGHQDWTRVIEVLAGSEISLNAILVAEP